MLKKFDRLDKDDREQRILHCATNLFNTYGIDDTPFLQIAKEAKISRSLLYHYFPSKSSLIDALLKQAGLQIEQRISLEKGSSDEQTLYHAFNSFFNAILQEPTFNLSRGRLENRSLDIYKNFDSLVQAHINNVCSKLVTLLDAKNQEAALYSIRAVANMIIAYIHDVKIKNINLSKDIAIKICIRTYFELYTMTESLMANHEL